MTSSFLRVALVCALFIVGDRALATPRLALISGTRCSACHFTPHGGGIRTELGWGSMDQVGAFRWPWQPAKASDAGEDSGEDLFNTPPEAGSEEVVPETTPEGGDDTGSTTTDDGTSAAEGFETQDPLPAHEPTVADEAAPADEPPADAGATEDEPVTEPHTNTLFDGLITPGVDVRVQVAKIGRPPNEVRMVLPMQTQLNLAVTPGDWLAVYAGFNYSVLHYNYAGQSSWEATAQLHPDVTLPTLRLGYMQPSIGVRHDDHTTFTRREVAGSQAHTLIPPGYAELGAELSYEGMNWLTVNAGVFSSKNLADIEPSVGTIEEITDFSKPSILGRIVLWPQDLDLGFNGELGASYFANGDFRMINVFGGLGLSDRGSFLVEGLLADYPGTRRVRNVSVMGSYQLFAWLSLNWRYEWAQTEQVEVDPTQTELAHATQAVFGFEFFLFPGVEIRPEYRFFQTEPFAEFGGYQIGQYTVQLHVFY
jgi:hypothetical protein